jgi:hypothetical protein
MASLRDQIALVEVQQSQAKAGLDLDKQVLDAQVASTQANANLAAATLALYEAFHPKTTEPHK